ncbi:MAG: hypothetical protein KJ957_04355, partial [Candidatus Omnitrophica bacterium]|nr:hypothetical protein [Candidatus Omnitrophota bacterium]
ALLCLYCGGSLNRSVGFMGKLKYPTPRIISSIVVVLTLIGFILLISIFSGCRSIYVGGSGKVGEVTGSGGVNIPVPTK